MKRTPVPREMKWLFWNQDFQRLDVQRDADAIIATIVEFGRHRDVQWMLRTYGRERVHAFFREVGSPEISDRTIAFWRAVFEAKGEKWPRPATWRKTSSAPWID